MENSSNLIINYDDGNKKYEGELENGKPNGNGTSYYPYPLEGTKEYEGQWKDGKRDGIGIRYELDGSKYVGEWKDDKMDGIGTFYYPDGASCKGGWKNGKMDGKGTLYYPDGEISYEGEWKDDKMDGEGIHMNNFIISCGAFFNNSFKKGMVISDSQLFHHDYVDNLSIDLEALDDSKRSISMEAFLEKLSNFSPKAQLQAIKILKQNKYFFNHLTSKVKLVNNLDEEIKEVNDDLLPYLQPLEHLYLKSLEARNLCENPDQYEGRWNLEYLNHIKEFEDLGLEPKDDKVLKQHNMYEFNQETDSKLKKLSGIEAYDSALAHIVSFDRENLWEIEFIHIKNSGISARDFLIFLIDKNVIINDKHKEELEEIIKDKKPAIHNTTYYFCKLLGNQKLELSGGVQLSQDNFLTEASNVVNAGLNDDNFAKIYFLDLKNTEIKSDDQLSKLINENKDCAILFKNQDGKIIPLDVSGLSKEKPSNSISPVSNKMIKYDDKKPEPQL